MREHELSLGKDLHYFKNFVTGSVYLEKCFLLTVAPLEEDSLVSTKSNMKVLSKCI